MPAKSELVTCTCATSAGSKSERKKVQEGWKRWWNASRRIGGLVRFGSEEGRREGWRKSDFASVALETEGFSRRMCFPARREERAYWW